MINATTHPVAEGVLHTNARPVRTINAHGFVVLMGIELVLLFGVFIWALLWLVPSATPFATQRDLTPVVETVRGSVSGTINDPLIDVGSGLSARASNLRGLRMAGATYYYYVEGRANFDPLSRGAVSNEEVEVMLYDDSGPESIVIYRLR